ncbi:MAG: aldehyde dehydrogenase [Flavobacterium sp.]|nr:aldehyde dehydrogenase [Flavobacterium sp.]
MNFKTDISFRKKTLLSLLENIIHYENEILEAMYKDFKKPFFEGFLTETNYVVTDLKATLKNIDIWSKPKKVNASILNFPSSDYIYSEPYGNVLIISPWNYPYQLALCPLIAAVAAGNSVTLKPSENTPNTSLIIAKIIRETFNEKHVVAILGDAGMAEQLLKQRWDYIFFTGSVAVGKIIAKIAAQNLTPVTLELGGKSPCIVDQTANIKLSARRIIWGKLINAGQTCVAPDYILVHKKVKSELIENLKIEIKRALGENPEISPDFARIVNQKNWDRQLQLLENQNVIFGGQSAKSDYYLAPTLIDEPNLDSQLMQEEIFGPILPIISYETKSDIKKIISSYDKPLSLYMFSEKKSFVNDVIAEYSFGGGCVNDVVIHLANNNLPFGGVGNSGIGAYHGKYSFDTFSHKKSIVKRGTWLDIPIRYAPYDKKLIFLRKILKWF